VTGSDGTTDAPASAEPGSQAAELAATRDELRRSRQRLETFGGQVSHDLRNPLTSVSMSLQMLAEQPSVVADDEARWMVARALSGAERMDDLIEELLQYATLSARLHRTSIDLSALVAEVADELAEPLRGASLQLGRLPVVCGDRQQMAAVLHHLIANAATFTHPDVPPVITVAAARVTEGWRVEVADNGPGVAAEDTTAVFEPRKGEATRGLVTCRRIVKAHGGTIGMTGSATGGTAVWFELPDGG
jgi:signal transduction histidine kinase